VNADFGHHPVVGPRIVRNVPRLDQALLDRFAAAYAPDVSDAVGELYTMSSCIGPLYRPAPRLVGQALTVKAPPGDNLTVHGALGMIQPGDVLVIDWRGYTGGCGTGAGSLVVPFTRGLAGVVVDGGWRDIGELRDLGLPVYGRSVSVFSPPKQRPGEINVPVCCGGVVVHAGPLRGRGRIPARLPAPPRPSGLGHRGSRQHHARAAALLSDPIQNGRGYYPRLARLEPAGPIARLCVMNDH
jgi:4-hydroxy-4-methyl-2-oxoglutarate aldolase